jgi:hypothetical protein
MLIQSNVDEVRSSCIDKSGALVFRTVLEQLLAEIISKRI